MEKYLVSVAVNQNNTPEYVNVCVCDACIQRMTLRGLKIEIHHWGLNVDVSYVAIHQSPRCPQNDSKPFFSGLFFFDNRSYVTINKCYRVLFASVAHRSCQLFVESRVCHCCGE